MKLVDMEMSKYQITTVGIVSLLFLIESILGSNLRFEAPTVNLQQLCPRGLRLWMADAANISFVGYHVSINNPLIGASPSEFSVALGRPIAGHWTFDIPNVYLQKDDKVFYWLHIIVTNHSYIKTDMSWTVTAEEIRPETIMCAPKLNASFTNITVGFGAEADYMIDKSACSHTNATHLQCHHSATVSGKKPVCAGQLLFEDQFNNLDLEIWQHEKTGSGGKFSEFNMFVNNRSNSFAHKGILHIRPTLTEEVFGEDFLYNGVLDLRSSSPVGEKCTDPGNDGCYRSAVGAQILNPVLSAKIQTSISFTFKYGIVKVRAKMPQGDWLWPAVILLPKHSAYGDWPKSGQVNVVQSRGNTNLMSGKDHVGVQRVEVGLEFGLEKQAITAHLNSKDHGDWSADFHDFQMEWRPDGMQFLVDGNPILNITPSTEDGLTQLLPSNIDHSLVKHLYQDGSKMAPFDQQFYLAISLTVGGVSGYFSDDAINIPHRKPWNNTSPSPALDFWEKRNEWWPDWKKHHSEFLIDYVKIWALP